MKIEETETLENQGVTQEKEEEIPPCPYCGEEHYPFSADATPYSEPECWGDD